jgi:putative hemolysin
MPASGCRARCATGHGLADQPLQAALYVPETITGMELLDNFRLSDVHMAFVIDEYGEVQGIVTLQDLIEAITGEFQPRDPETSWACSARTAAGCWMGTSRCPNSRTASTWTPCRRKSAAATTP